VCSSSNLMGLLCDLLENSVTIQQQMMQNKGFLVIAYLLEKVNSKFPVHTLSHLHTFVGYKVR
jgi:hypothetical protein